MPRKKPHRIGDPDPNRLENAIPRAIRDANIDELRLHIQRAQENDLLSDALIKNAMRTACEKDSLEALRFLLEHAKPYHVNNGQAKTNETLLMIAKSSEVAQLLLDNGAEVNAIDTFGRTALMHAASKEIAMLFIKHGADIETNHQQARCALMHVLMQDKPSTFDARTEIAHYLIHNGANLTAVDTQQRTLLMTAVWRNNISVVRTLLEKVDVNATDLRGRNLLHHLCEDRDRASRMLSSPIDADKLIADLVLASKVQINVQDAYEGKTPLHRATERNNVYLVQALLNRPQTEIDILDFRGKTSLHVAAANAHKELLELLLSKGADAKAESDGGWTPLHNAAAGKGKGRDIIVKILLSRGASPTARLRTGKLPLHLACEAGDVEVVKLLLEQPNVNITARDYDGNTPLISAAKLGHTHIVKHLTPLSSHASARSEDAIKASKGFL